MQSIIALLALVAVAAAYPADPHSSYHEPQYKDTPPKYEYKYGVDAQDGYKGYVKFDANEARDGYATYGSYRVLLPDGRTQIVTYKTDDGYSGNVMDVKYEGKASYAPAPVHKAAPSYKPAPPAPSYKPAPTYHA